MKKVNRVDVSKKQKNGGLNRMNSGNLDSLSHMNASHQFSESHQNESSVDYSRNVHGA